MGQAGLSRFMHRKGHTIFDFRFSIFDWGITDSRLVWSWSTVSFFLGTGVTGGKFGVVFVMRSLLLKIDRQ